MQLITNNPNPKAVTIEFESGIVAQAFSRFSLNRSPDAYLASPLFAGLCGRSADVIRTDFIQSGSSSTLSVVRKFMEWSEPEKTGLLAHVRANIDDTVNGQELVNRFNQLGALDETRLLVKLIKNTIQETAREKLNRDGGDIIIDDVPMSGSDFTARIVLLGSCAGCDHSTLTTLDGIEKRIDASLKGLKAHPNFQGVDQVQKLQFRGLETIDIPKGFYSLKAKP